MVRAAGGILGGGLLACPCFLSGQTRRSAAHEGSLSTKAKISKPLAYGKTAKGRFSTYKEYYSPPKYPLVEQEIMEYITKLSGSASRLRSTRRLNGLSAACAVFELLADTC